MTIRTLLRALENIPDNEKDYDLFFEDRDGTFFMVRDINVMRADDHEFLEKGEHFFTVFHSPTEPLQN